MAPVFANGQAEKEASMFPIEFSLRRQPNMVLVVLGALSLCVGGVILFLSLVLSAQDATGERANSNPASGSSDVEVVPGINKQLVEVKFEEGSEIRLREGRLVSMRDWDLSALYDLLARTDIVGIDRVFTDAEEELERLRSELADQPGPPLPDLNLFYRIGIGPRTDADRFIEELLALDVVEDAQFYRQPIDALVNTPDLTSQQDYCDAAPSGIGATYASGVPGGRGSGIDIIDLELAWNLSHEDLPTSAASLLSGSLSSDQGHVNHGTAVLGVLAGQANGFGVTGIAPEATVRAISWNGGSTAQAIYTATQNLAAGDVMLLEGQIAGPQWLGECDGTSQDGCVPMEYATTNRAAIIAAIKKGIIVVEAAGNGGNNLDQSDYQGRFDRDSATYPDSGAIVVGAGHAPGNADPNKVARSRMSESNYGDRVDLQGWGESVVTTGYGDLFDGGANRLYTDVFSGTSAASAMAAGAAASLQGAWLAANASPLSPACVRKMLVETGSPQVNDPLSMFAANIGPLPDLEAALKLSAQEVAYLCGFEINFHKPDLYWLPLIRIIIPDHWVELLVWLANGGPAPIERGYMVEFYVDNELVHRQAGPRLEPADRAEMAFRYERIREGQSVRIVADAQRELDELDEANNEFLLVLEGACE